MWNIGLRSKTVTVLLHRSPDLDLALAELELEHRAQLRTSSQPRPAAPRSVR